MAKPLRITFREERYAVAFTDELAGLAPIEVDDLQTKEFLVSTLNAVRRTLSGQPSATAEVVVDGDTYQMCGD